MIIIYARHSVAPLGKWGAEKQQARLEMGGSQRGPMSVPKPWPGLCTQAHLAPDPAGLPPRERPPALFSVHSRSKKVKPGRAFSGWQPTGEPTGWALRSPDRLPRPQHAHTPPGTASRPCTPHSTSGSKSLQPPGSTCVLLCEGKQLSALPSSALSRTQQAFVGLV